MMKAVLLFAAALTAHGQDQVMNAQCAFDGAQAASEMSDVVVYMWAAQQRCAPAPTGHPNSPKCTVDIAASLKALNDMVTIIVKAVNDCTTINTENYECGMAVSKLTGGAMGLTKATANTLHYCPSAQSEHGVPADVNPSPKSIDTKGLTDIGKCIVNVKAATSNIFKAALEASKIKSSCAGDSITCGRNALHLIGAVGSMGGALGIGINKCEKASGRTGNVDSACAGAITEAVAAIVKVTDAGLGIQQKCVVKPERLYELENAEKQAKGSSLNIMMVAALVPIFAVFSFVAGSKFRRGHVQPTERSRGFTAYEGEDVMLTSETSYL